MVFTKRELKQLKKYVKGSIVYEEDSLLIKMLQSVRMATSGFCKEEGKIFETSKLTSLGYNHYLTSRIEYNPIKKFLCSFAHI